MDALYESLFTSNHMVRNQFVRGLGPELADSSHWAVLVSPERELWSSDEGRLRRVFAERGIVDAICDRIDDGADPVLTPLEGGCVAACELYTETRSAGYLLLVLEGYSLETAKTNMDLIELLFSQFRMVCSLIEKNNQFHQLKLSGLSKRPVQMPC